MKTAHRKPFALVLALVLASSLLSTYAAASESQVITKKEFKTLLKTAKEPAEHRKIAAYYRQEAARLTASAKEHEELAEFYPKNPPFPAMGAKNEMAFGQGAQHCKRWAEFSAKQAKEAEALAAIHEEMAKAAEQR